MSSSNVFRFFKGIEWNFDSRYSIYECIINMDTVCCREAKCCAIRLREIKIPFNMKSRIYLMTFYLQCIIGTKKMWFKMLKWLTNPTQLLENTTR